MMAREQNGDLMVLHHHTEKPHPMVSECIFVEKLASLEFAFPPTNASLSDWDNRFHESSICFGFSLSGCMVEVDHMDVGVAFRKVREQPAEQEYGVGSLPNRRLRYEYPHLPQF
jgi:hypothetical protein